MASTEEKKIENEMCNADNQQKVNACIKHFKLSWNNDHHHCHYFIILENADSVKLSLPQSASILFSKLFL